jgi:hypothetical protein
VKSKEQPIGFERGVRMSVVKEEGEYTFLEVFLIVSLIFHENVKKKYISEKRYSGECLLRQLRP